MDTSELELKKLEAWRTQTCVHGEILRSGGNAWTREEDKDHSRIILEPGKERINKTRILGFKGHEISHEIHPEIKYIIYTSPYYTRIDTVR